MEDTARFGSVDWAAQSHAACVVDAQGQVADEFTVEHTAAGLRTLCRRFARAGVRRVAIERPDGPVVDALLAAGLEVVVVPSRAVKALRTRYGLAGNKADRSDAFVLADCLRMPDEAIFRLDQSYGALSIVDWLYGSPLVRVVNAQPTMIAARRRGFLPALADERPVEA